jgi:hypothetical protein
MHGILSALRDIADPKGILTVGRAKGRIKQILEADVTATHKLHRAGVLLMGQLASYASVHQDPAFAPHVAQEA